MRWEITGKMADGKKVRAAVEAVTEHHARRIAERKMMSVDTVCLATVPVQPPSTPVRQVQAERLEPVVRVPTAARRVFGKYALVCLGAIGILVAAFLVWNGNRRSAELKADIERGQKATAASDKFREDAARKSLHEADERDAALDRIMAIRKETLELALKNLDTEDDHEYTKIKRDRDTNKITQEEHNLRVEALKDDTVRKGKTLIEAAKRQPDISDAAKRKSAILEAEFYLDLEQSVAKSHETNKRIVDDFRNSR